VACPTSEIVTVNAQLTYHLGWLWRPLHFYLLFDYWTCAGETILRYDSRESGIILGIALSR